jgi:hypothetical protein
MLKLAFLAKFWLDTQNKLREQWAFKKIKQFKAEIQSVNN